MKIIIIVGCLGILGGLAFWYDWTPDGEKSDLLLTDAFFDVRRGPMKITVNEDGFLKAKNSIKIEPQFRREGTISWLIEEGTEVEEGEVLVEFEKTDVQNQIDELENRLLQHETELKSATANLEIQERDSEASIEKAVQGLKISEMTLQRWEKGEAPNEERRKILAVDKAKSDLDRQMKRFEKVPELFEAGFFSEYQVEEKRMALEEAKITLKNAESDLDLYLKFTQEIERVQKNAEVTDAKRLLENATKKAEINLNEKKARVKQQESQVKSSTVRLDKLKKEFEYMTIKAPAPGIVHFGEPDERWYRERIKVGGRVWPGNTLLTIPDLREMQVLVQVHEADIDAVKEGMDAVITVEAVKGVTFAGKVTKIASVASSNWRDPNNRTFRVEITMESSGKELRAGISASVEIGIEEIPDTLNMPIHAVFNEGGEQFCFVAENGSFAKRSIKTGKNNAHYVQILEGLEEDEHVLLYDPREGGRFGEDSEEEGGDPAQNGAAVDSGLVSQVVAR